MRIIGDKNLQRYVGDKPVVARYIGNKKVFEEKWVVRGAIHRFCGVDNVGAGVHDSYGTNWTDIIGGVQATLQNVSWTDNSALFAGNADAKITYAGQNVRDYTIISTHKTEGYIGAHPRIWGEMPYPSLFINTNVGVYGFYGQGKDTTFTPRISSKIGEKIHTTMRYAHGQNKVELFVNGVKATEVTGVTAAPGDVDMMTIGARPTTNDRTFHGEFYEHAVYSVALTDEEIMQNFRVSNRTYGIEVGL